MTMQFLRLRLLPVWIFESECVHVPFPRPEVLHPDALQIDENLLPTTTIQPSEIGVEGAGP